MEKSKKNCKKWKGCVFVCAFLGGNHLCWHSRVCILSVHRDLVCTCCQTHAHTHTNTHIPDENQLTAWPASSDVPTPVPFINVQPKAAGLGPTASPTRLNSTPTKQTQRERQRETDMRAKRKTFKQSEAQNVENVII